VLNVMNHCARVSPVSLLIFLSSAFLVVAGGVFTTSAQGPGLEGPTVWDGVFTEAQAERGGTAYAANCSRCHGDELDGGGRFAALVGDPWMGNFQTQSVEDLFNFISTNMPNGNGGSLSDSMYLDLAAFILSSNDMPAGDAELTASSGAAVTIIAEDGELLALTSGTLVRVVGCLAEGDDGFVVNNATAPERLNAAGVGPEDATVALGAGSFPLLFVLSPIDEFVGHRVSVSGLSDGEGAVNGINVTLVESVGESCE
jgi:cytochrome c553